MRNKLSAREVAGHVNRPVSQMRIIGDGDGLYLRLRPQRAAAWIFLSIKGGKRREIGLGVATDVNLGQARERASSLRLAIARGSDPFAEAIAGQSGKASMPAEPQNFGEFADAMVAELEGGWTNAVHKRQWRQTFKVQAEALRPLPLAEVTTTKVLEVLRPLWNTHQETASRVRGRIERVLDAARAKGLIAPPWENPARWRGNLAHLLPARRKLTTRGHQAAMPFEDIPKFIVALRQRTATAARALEFTILCATRTNETLQAKREEFDLDRATWIIPAERTKLRREHRVPLSDRAVEILKPLCEGRGRDSFVFASDRTKPLSPMAMMMLMRRMKLGHLTVHGTARSSFRDWAGECTDHSEAVAEAALAHSVGDATVRAYRRGDAFAKRRLLMQDWSDYCCNVDPARPDGGMSQPRKG